MICPLCGQRKARRGCPGVGGQICSVCCGTKRLVEIRCPSDCVYLATAREHPAAAVVRQQQRDITVLLAALRDFNERQSQMFLLVANALLQYQPAELHALVDDDVIEAAGALAETYETASRGVIYDHRPQTAAGERLWTALKGVLAEAGQHGGSAFERDAAGVLRAIAASARDAQAIDAANRSAFLDLLKRTIKQPPRSEAPREDSPRLIVP